MTTVEVKQVDLPQDMQRAMSKQAEAERERRAKVINAEGEYQAAEKLASPGPGRVNVRAAYSETLVEGLLSAVRTTLK